MALIYWGAGQLSHQGYTRSSCKSNAKFFKRTAELWNWDRKRGMVYTIHSFLFPAPLLMVNVLEFLASTFYQENVFWLSTETFLAFSQFQV